MPERRHERFTKRLETTFASGDLKHRGISSDLSEGGLFIRTRQGLVPGSAIDIELYLPNGKVSRNRGIVKRTTKAAATVASIVKNGMGVQLIETDSNYREFLIAVGIIPERRPAGQAEEKEKVVERTAESVIIACPSCGAKNRITGTKLFMGPKCGKCGAALSTKDIG